MTSKRMALAFLTAALPLFAQFKPGDQATFGFTRHDGSFYAFRDGERWPPTYNVPFTSTTLADPFANLTNKTFAFPAQGVTLRIDSVLYQTLPPTVQGRFNVDSGCCTGNLYPLNPPPNLRIVVQGSVTLAASGPSTSINIGPGSGYDTAMCGQQTQTPLSQSPTTNFKWDSGDCPDTSPSFTTTGFDKTTGLYTVGNGLNAGWNINFDFRSLAGGHTLSATLNAYPTYLPCAGGDCGGLPDIQVKALRVTQTVQDASNAVPLVAGRPTVVRAWVRTRGSVTEPAEKFTAVLHAVANGKELTASGSPLPQNARLVTTGNIAEIGPIPDPPDERIAAIGTLREIGFQLPVDVPRRDVLRPADPTPSLPAQSPRKLARPRFLRQKRRRHDRRRARCEFVRVAPASVA